MNQIVAAMIEIVNIEKLSGLGSILLLVVRPLRKEMYLPIKLVRPGQTSCALGHSLKICLANSKCNPHKTHIV